MRNVQILNIDGVHQEASSYAPNAPSEDPRKVLEAEVRRVQRESPDPRIARPSNSLQHWEKRAEPLENDPY